MNIECLVWVSCRQDILSTGQVSCQHHGFTDVLQYSTGGSNKTRSGSCIHLKNTVYIGLHNVDVSYRYGTHHILTKIDRKFFKNILTVENLIFEFENLTVRKSKK